MKSHVLIIILIHIKKVYEKQQQKVELFENFSIKNIPTFKLSFSKVFFDGFHLLSCLVDANKKQLFR